MMTQLTSAVEIANRLHQAGAALLASGPGELLRGVGEVTPSGSYYLDLMAWPDLDLYLPLEPSEEYLARFLELGPRLASICQVISLSFKDCIHYPEPHFPQGLYWGVRLEQGTGLRWKLDIWAFPPAVIEAQQAELDRLKHKLTPQARARILEIKQALITPEGRTPPLSGYNIYCAVLDCGLVSLEEVKAYLLSQGVNIG